MEKEVLENKYLNDYLDYLKYQKNYSDYTVLSYSNDIVEYLEYLQIEYLDFKSVEYSDIRFYLMYLKDKKKDNNSSIDSTIADDYNLLVDVKWRI